MRQPRENPTIAQLAETLMPSDAIEPILAPPVRAALHEWLTEIWSADDLEAVGLKPRKSALLYGPPGCGKTTLAHHLAARLGVPMHVVGTDQLRSQYIGETGRNIGALFRALNHAGEKHVLFLDEFDTLAAERTNDNHGSGREANAIVNHLLTHIPDHDGILIAATNRSDAIDPAIWRRFDLQIDIALPGADERFAILKRYLHPYELPDGDLDRFVAATAGAPPSLLRQVMEGIKRALIIGPKLGRAGDAGSVLASITAAVRPHEAYSAIPLWDDARLVKRIATATAWPPEQPRKAA